MPRQLTSLASLFFALFGLLGCSKQSVPTPETSSENVAEDKVSSDLKFVDDYLDKWDRFAQGESELVPHIRENKEGFERALTRLLVAKDGRAPARLVFYAVVQVGGFIPLESDLGKASRVLLGPNFPISTPKEGSQAYFAGELYFWWQTNHEKYVNFPLFEEWSQRDFTQTVAVPMYKAACKRK
jgi:hypothetical protein